MTVITVYGSTARLWHVVDEFIKYSFWINRGVINRQTAYQLIIAVVIIVIILFVILIIFIDADIIDVLNFTQQYHSVINKQTAYQLI